MLEHFLMSAAYNAWANEAVYAAAAELGDADYRVDTGAFFGSLHRTLNHLLVTDRIWMKRMTGTGEAPATLDAILCADLAGLQAARVKEDARISDWVATLTETALASIFTYTPVSTPQPVTQRLAPVLAHLFNHQTHHRGQCHMILTSLGRPSLTLDMISFQRHAGKSWA
jgi:uncharacterized damage-inducible protein DinB